MKKPPKLPPHHQAWLDAHSDRTAEWLRSIIQQGFEIHHGDSDHENNHPDNLFLIERSDHTRLHGIFSLGWRVDYRRRRPPKPKPEYVEPEQTHPTPPPEPSPHPEPQEGEIRLGVAFSPDRIGMMAWETMRVEESQLGYCVFIQKSEFDAFKAKCETARLRMEAATQRKKAEYAASKAKKPIPNSPQTPDIRG